MMFLDIISFPKLNLIASVKFLCLLSFTIILFEYSKSEDVCSLNLNRVLNESNEMLFLKDKTPPEFAYPKGLSASVIKLEEGDRIRVICGSNSQIIGCQKNQLWKNDVNVQLTNFSCNQKWLKYTSGSTSQTSAACPTNVECIQIGFPLNVFEFASTIDLIYLNVEKKRPLWAHATIVSSISDKQDHIEAIREYGTCDIFQNLSVSMDDIFNKDYQKNHFSKIFHDDESSEMYISDEGTTIFQPGGEHLVRGLLIHNKDFFYKPQQYSVNHYANIMPVWKSIAYNNWYLSGEIIRKIAIYTKSSLELWSGGIGTLQLEDFNKTTKKTIYLATDESGNEVIPVPKILFKYVYKPSSNQGVVILTVNNPFLKKLSNDYVLCNEQSICQVLYSKFKIFSFGYTYCCSLKDFAIIAKKRGMPSYPNAKPLFQPF